METAVKGCSFEFLRHGGGEGDMKSDRNLSNRCVGKCGSYHMVKQQTKVDSGSCMCVCVFMHAQVHSVTMHMLCVLLCGSVPATCSFLCSLRLSHGEIVHKHASSCYAQTGP